MSKKHIKFKATPVAPDFQKVKVQIMEQTHRNNDFGIGGIGNFTYSDYTLNSARYPAPCGAGGAYVRGNSISCDDRAIELPVAEYAKFKAAVEAYNKEFGKDKRHIKVEATPSEDFSVVEISVLEQSHFGEEFGNKNSLVLNNSLFYHGDIILGSYNAVGMSKDTYDKKLRVFLRSSGEKNDSTSKVDVPIEKWPAVRAAIEAYNAFDFGAVAASTVTKDSDGISVIIG